MWPPRPLRNKARIFLQIWISESFLVSHPSQTKLTVECQKDRDCELVKRTRVKGVDLSPTLKWLLNPSPSPDSNSFSKISKNVKQYFKSYKVVNLSQSLKWHLRAQTLFSVSPKYWPTLKIILEKQVSKNIKGVDLSPSLQWLLNPSPGPNSFPAPPKIFWQQTIAWSKRKGQDIL